MHFGCICLAPGKPATTQIILGITLVRVQQLRYDNIIIMVLEHERGGFVCTCTIPVVNINGPVVAM